MRVAVLVALMSAACGGGAADVTIDDSGAEPWLVAALRDAGAQWLDHDVDVHFARGGVPVTSFTASKPWGYTVRNDDERATSVHVNARAGTISDRFLACVVMHEIGHVVGLNHVADGEDGDDDASLMRPVEAIPYDGRECYWSENDETELFRALRGIPP